jgi:starch phosphorylase
VQDKTESENLSKVLYPSDTTLMGRELRLRQQYFFVSASLQDILSRFSKHHDSLLAIPDKVAIQLNDTHPSVAIPELMRILLDLHQIDWETAWDITVRTFAYTNHTLLPEALETWPIEVFERVLPRHMEIVYEINQRFLQQVRHRFPGDADILGRVSLIDDRDQPRLRMAHLAIVGSHRVNGVAALHSRLLRETLFRDFNRIYTGKFINITNGVTPRRWLNQANPGLTRLINKHVHHGWLVELDRLEEFAAFAEDTQVQEQFRAVKRTNKEHLVEVIRMRTGLEVNVDSLFDVQAKRIHEYKRQILNLLHVITLYNRLIDEPARGQVPRTVIFGGKAAPGYQVAKLIIKLINDVADVVNNDPRIGDRLKVAFVPNYDVSTASEIIPAADLSEQISTAGTEASGTGNMKLALNGALTIGTLDGANIEIMEAVGKDNIFIFGMNAEEVASLREQGYDPSTYYQDNTELRRALDMIAEGYFCTDSPDRFKPITDSLTQRADPYVVLADFGSYLACQQRVDALYRNPQEWTRRAMLNVARMGHFSSDRAVREYAEKVWGVTPVVRD